MKEGKGKENSWKMQDLYNKASLLHTVSIRFHIKLYINDVSIDFTIE